MTDHSAANRFAANRDRLAETMPPRSAALFFTAEHKVRSGDTEYPFCQDRNYYYLTGLDEPDGRLLCLRPESGPARALLFTFQRDAHDAHWFGASLPPERAREISGIAEVFPLAEFEGRLESLLAGLESLLVDHEPPRLRGPVPPRLQFVDLVRQRCPGLAVRSAGPLVHALREVKADWEIERIARACELTDRALRRVLAVCRPGLGEWELEAHFDFALHCERAVPGFRSIVAGGANATVLHYDRNSAEIAAGSLVLLDVGAEFDHYSADVSRTVPAGGRFSPRQRELYELVLESNRATIAAVAPGVSFARLNEVAREPLARGLAGLGVIREADEVKRFFTHGVSHELGLDTHDVAAVRPQVCRPGMVLTVEPGLYLPDEGIGIRIEDDVAVTESGCRVLTEMIPKTVEEIEKLVGSGI